MICCNDLINLKCFETIKLVSGESGLGNYVSWPFICTTPTISEWIHGGELLFITGAGLKNPSQDIIYLLDECKSKNPSGVVILIGPNNVPDISQDIINFTNELKLPLFKMPWNIKLIDATQEISQLIMNVNHHSKKYEYLLSKILLLDKENFDYKYFCHLYNFPNKPYRFIATINIVYPESDHLHSDYIQTNISYHLESRLNNSEYSCIPMQYANNIISLCTADSLDQCEELTKILSSIFLLFKEQYSNINLYLTYGQIYTGDLDIFSSYQESQKALSFLKKNTSFKNNILSYSNSGIFKLFFEIEKIDTLKSFYLNNLEPILLYDAKNSSELLHTLYTYLEHNKNLLKTAKTLFIHRNTLIYRLNTIEKLLNKDLSNAFIAHELFISLLSYKFIEQ